MILIYLFVNCSTFFAIFLAARKAESWKQLLKYVVIIAGVVTPISLILAPGNYCTVFWACAIDLIINFLAKIIIMMIWAAIVFAIKRSGKGGHFGT